jgi:membrane-associated phospholipid phosphatase
MKLRLALPALGALAAMAFTPAAASAQTAPRELSVNVPVDLAVTGGLGALWIGSELAKSSLVPSGGCRWCARNSFDESVRNALWIPGAEKRIGLLADLNGFLLVPALAYGNLAFLSQDANRPSYFWKDALIVTEVATVAAALNQGTKFFVARERPFVRNKAAGSSPVSYNSADDNLSFYSGHTSLAFSMAAATGTVAQMRGYRYTPYVWATGFSLAAFVGYLRIAADKHYMSDVLVGAATGTAAGVLIPLLFHPIRKSGDAPSGMTTRGFTVQNIAPNLSTQGATVTFGGVF